MTENTSIENLIAKYFGVVDWVISKIPYDRLPKWKRFFLAPEEVVSEGPETIVSNIKNIYVHFLLRILSAMPLLIVSGIVFLLVASARAVAGAFTAMGFGVALLILIPAVIILYPLFFLISAGIEYATAKILRSTADFKTHFNASILPALSLSVVLFPANFVHSVFSVLGMIPIAGFVCNIISYPLLILVALVDLYSIYLKYRAFKVVHKLDTLKTAIVTLIVPILALLIVSLGVLFFIVSGWSSVLRSLGILS